MRAAVRDKRINLFKKYFPDHTVSRKGNFVATIGTKKDTRVIVHNGYNITKSLVDKVGKTTTIPISSSDIVLVMATTGKFLIKFTNERNFKRTTMKSINRVMQMYFGKDNIYREKVRRDIAEIFFIGRKYEYLKNYPQLWNFKLFENFKSLKEVKIFLGMPFISDSEFANMFVDIEEEEEDDDFLTGVSDSIRDFDYIAPILLAKNKLNAYTLLKSIDNKSKNILKDYIKMCIDNEIEVVIPAGKNKLTELHDDVSLEIAIKNADKYSKKRVFRMDFPIKQDLTGKKHVFTKFWEYNNIEARRLETPYDMYLQGCKQKHCIGSNYYDSLDKYSFYSINWKGEDYDIQIHQNGRIGQFYGKRNCNPPIELKTLITHENCDYEHRIIPIEGIDLKDYPLKTRSKRRFGRSC